MFELEIFVFNFLFDSVPDQSNSVKIPGLQSMTIEKIQYYIFHITKTKVNPQ